MIQQASANCFIIHIGRRCNIPGRYSFHIGMNLSASCHATFGTGVHIATSLATPSPVVPSTSQAQHVSQLALHIVNTETDVKQICDIRPNPFKRKLIYLSSLIRSATRVSHINPDPPDTVQTHASSLCCSGSGRTLPLLVRVCQHNKCICYTLYVHTRTSSYHVLSNAAFPKCYF